MSSKEVHYDDDDFELEEEEDVVSGAEVKSFHHSFSIGVDAKITWNFHLAREANPENFTSRGMNKFKYFTEGVSSIIGGGCKGLAQAIEFLEIDGRLIWGEELPQVRTLHHTPTSRQAGELRPYLCCLRRVATGDRVTHFWQHPGLR
jgi:hypothetical protein